MKLQNNICAMEITDGSRTVHVFINHSGSTAYIPDQDKMANIIAGTNGATRDQVPAHGFVVLSDEAELLYKASGEYCPQADRGVLWSDKDINIDWEIDFAPILSDKDKVQPKLSEIDKSELL